MFASFMRLWGEVEDAGCWGACMAFQHIEVLRTSCPLRGRRPALHASSHIVTRLWLGNLPLLSLISYLLISRVVPALWAAIWGAYWHWAEATPALYLPVAVTYTSYEMMWVPFLRLV